ncbi:unnamed protein product [Paramecium sonneborni]|uniref:Uncharacterized protein n=1 Tax=Paramecium sonneborni TaxID=65129 RepID=A0A8S1M6Y0_9CILI|nr:unnamed protein product [Paramecium sonneborni]
MRLQILPNEDNDNTYYNSIIQSIISKLKSHHLQIQICCLILKSFKIGFGQQKNYIFQQMKDHSEETQSIIYQWKRKRIYKRKVATQLISFSDDQELRNHKKLLAQKILSNIKNKLYWN